jgi:hypothetical protein
MAADGGGPTASGVAKVTTRAASGSLGSPTRRVITGKQDQVAEMAASLDLQHSLLLRLVAAQEQQDAKMQAQSRWMVRQVARLLRNSEVPPTPGEEGDLEHNTSRGSTIEQPSLRERRGVRPPPVVTSFSDVDSRSTISPSKVHHEDSTCNRTRSPSRKVSVADEEDSSCHTLSPTRSPRRSQIADDSCGGRAQTEPVTTELSGGSVRSCVADPRRDSAPRAMFPSEATYVPEPCDAPGSSSIREASTCSVSSQESLGAAHGGRLTPPEELENLEHTLSRLKDSGKNFFIWGLTNSDDRRHGIVRGTFGKMAYACTHSIGFEVVVPIAIIANAILIGYQADWDMRHVGDLSKGDEETTFLWTNRAFTLAFLLELMIRIAADGVEFFYPSTKGFGWNAFDTFIILCSLSEEIVQAISSTRLSQISSVRVVRTLRLVRALRAIRVMRVFRELRIMVSGIMNCGKSLLWASLLIAIMTYTFAVLFLQVSSSWLKEQGATSFLGCGSSDQAGAACSVGSSFSSLIEGMYTLFKAMSGGSSWGEVSDPLTSIHPLVTFAFCVYIMMAVFVVLNVITAIFVDAAARTSTDEATKILDNIQRKSVWIKNAKELFQILDRKRAGWLEYKEIDRLFTDERAQSCLQEFGIDIDFQSTQVLFNLFDSQGRGGVDQDQFAKVLFRLHGQARSLDLARIHSMVCHMHKTLSTVNRRIDTLASLMGFSVSPSRRGGTTPGFLSPVRRRTSPPDQVAGQPLPPDRQDPIVIDA